MYKLLCIYIITHAAIASQGTGRIWLDNVNCYSYSTRLSQCSHLGWGVTRSCYHSEDVALQCTPPCSLQLNHHHTPCPTLHYSKSPDDHGLRGAHQPQSTICQYQLQYYCRDFNLKFNYRLSLYTVELLYF